MKKKQPGLEMTQMTGQALAIKLHEPRYWDSSDALNLCEISAGEDISNADHLRQFLQRYWPRWMLDVVGKEQRDIDEMHDALQKKKKMLKKSAMESTRVKEIKGKSTVKDPEKGEPDGSTPKSKSARKRWRRKERKTITGGGNSY
jgi:hypothetical protein